MCLILIWFERYIRINLHLTQLNFLLRLVFGAFPYFNLNLNLTVCIVAYKDI